MNRLKLKAQIRKKVDRDGKIPAVVYGAKIKNYSIEVFEKDFFDIYKEAGESSLIDLVISNGGKSESPTVLIHELERDPVSGKLLHIDFLAVNMDKPVKVEVHLNYIGESKAIMEEGGILVQSLTSIEIESLPGDLPKTLEIDISRLTKIGASLKVSDLEIKHNLKVLTDQDQIVASIVKPRITDESASEVEKEEGEEEKEGEAQEDKKEDSTDEEN